MQTRGDVRSHPAPQRCGASTDVTRKARDQHQYLAFRKALELILMPDEATLKYWKMDDSEWFSGSATRPDVRTRI
jgi:hypothetical protein